MLDVRRSLGQYSTPIQTASYMAKRLLSFFSSTEDLRILDPAVGDGVFIQTLADYGVKPTAMKAFDIDRDVVANGSAIPCTVFQQDFLTYPLHVDSEQTGEFDAIIGNPPYKSKRESNYIKQNRHRLERQFKEIGIQNMYSMFIVHAIRRLREGGILCFIVQDSFLTNVYYKNFRRFLVENCLIHEITLAPRRLFHQHDADVRTAILILEKCTGMDKSDVRASHGMKLVDRLTDEAEYLNPPKSKIQLIAQKAFIDMDQHNFFINVPEPIIDIILTAEKQLGDVVEGGTGISTGHDARFLRKVTDGNPEWVPFYKNGGFKDDWYYETPYQISRDWQTPSRQHKGFLARNSDFYFREGITCSSMGIAFSAAYLPPGCLFGVNANFFCASRNHLFYVLGFLNSLLAKYLVRAIYNRTNMVTAGYLKRLPYIEPQKGVKSAVSKLSMSIVHKKREDPFYDFSSLQAKIDTLIFATYGISTADEAHIRQFCANMFEAI